MEVEKKPSTVAGKNKPNHTKGTNKFSKDNNKVKDTVMLWDKEAASELLQTAFLAAVPEKSCRDLTGAKEAGQVETAEEPLVHSVSEKMTCSLCTVNFADRNEQVEHFKSDWHRFNIKQKLKGTDAVAEDRFEELMHTDDMSSISGSESDSDSDSDDTTVEPCNQGGGNNGDSDDMDSVHVEGIGKRHPRVFFRNRSGELFSIYRCVIHGKKNAPPSPAALIKKSQAVPGQMMWALFMSAGGHFAAAVFEGDKVLIHKSFHRYVVRAKRGTAQGSRDKQGSAPKSAGATLRRYNEAALTQEIQDLINLWAPYLQKCDRIFLRAYSFNKQIYFGGKTPALDRRDPRIQMIPFQTRRPTFSEIKRVHQGLATVECYGTEGDVIEQLGRALPKKHRSSTPQPTSIKDTSAQSASIAEPDGVSIISVTSTPVESTVRADTLTDWEVVAQQDGASPSDGMTQSRRMKSEENSMTVSTDTLTQWDVVTQRDVTLFDVAIPEEESEDGAEEQAENDKDVELFSVDASIDLTELRQFECTKKPRHRKKDKPKDKQKEASPNKDHPDDEWSELKNNLYTACKTGDVDTLDALLSSLTLDQEAARQEGLADAPGSDPSQTSQSDTVSERPALGEIMNAPFGTKKTTLLHIASVVGSKGVVGRLLGAGADPVIRDAEGHYPYVVAANKDTRNEFRRYMAAHPDRHDYAKAQIPGGLTEEMEMEKKAREADKKKVQRKARKERLKEQKEEEARIREEESEQQRFLALSDREKRALAAERRFAAQVTAQQLPPTTVILVIRCFQCGTDLTGRVPFEYSENKFCTTTCLQTHRRNATVVR